MAMCSPFKTYWVAKNISEPLVLAVCEILAKHVLDIRNAAYYSGDRLEVTKKLQEWILENYLRKYLEYIPDEFDGELMTMEKKIFYLNLLARTIILYICIRVYPDNHLLPRPKL
ncbi:hypothetical protein HC766_02400 [Candidatus Gracilibacteria bacterium]|nr:hypothetical protein [Candidatus Gracilibacteria bacterium]